MVEVLYRAIHDQLREFLGREVAHAGNQLHAHVVRVPFVAMELVWSNDTVVRTEEEQRGRAQRAIAVPAWNQRELA